MANSSRAINKNTLAIEGEKVKPVRTAFYIRVSTDEQTKTGFGVEMQKNALYDLWRFKAGSSNWVSKDEWFFIDDGYSGKDLKRPAYERMMDMVRQKEFDMVVVWKIDRISRNLTHLLNVFEELQSRGVFFFSLKENIDFSGAIGKLTFQIFGALAEFERKTIMMRTTEGKIASARMGNFTKNTTPFGYKKVPNLEKNKGKILVIDEEDAIIVRKIFEWFVYERKNYATIARELTDRYPQKKKNRKWHDGKVRELIQEIIYSGVEFVKFHKDDGKEEIVELHVPQIIDFPLFQQAQFLAEKISESKGKKGGGEHSYLLSRKIIYVESGRKFVGYQRGKGGHSYRHKKFTDAETLKEFGNIEIPGASVDNFVWEKILKLIRNPGEFFKIFLQQNNLTKEIANLMKEQEEVQKKDKSNRIGLTNADDDFYMGKISEERRDAITERYEKEIELGYARLQELQKEINKYVEMETSRKALEHFAKNFNQQLDNLTFEQKELIIEILVEKVEVSFIKGKLDVATFFRFAKNIGGDDDSKTNLKIPSGCHDGGIERDSPTCMEVPSGVEPLSKALQASVGPLYQGTKLLDCRNIERRELYRIFL